MAAHSSATGMFELVGVPMRWGSMEFDEYYPCVTVQRDRSKLERRQGTTQRGFRNVHINQGLPHGTVSEKR